MVTTPGAMRGLVEPLNVSDFWPARSVTGSGTVKERSVSASRMDTSAVNESLNCRVHWVDFPAATLAGEQANELNEKAGATTSVVLVVEEPKEAVIVPDC